MQLLPMCYLPGVVTQQVKNEKIKMLNIYSTAKTKYYENKTITVPLYMSVWNYELKE